MRSTFVAYVDYLQSTNLNLTAIHRDNPMLSDPKIAEVVISILSERGYAVTMDERIHETPKRVDPKTWDIILERTHVFALNVRFPQHHIQPLEQKF
jgi:adenylate kinase